MLYASAVRVGALKLGRARGALACLAVTGVLLLGCNDSRVRERECRTDDDCPPHHVCSVTGQCVPEVGDGGVGDLSRADLGPCGGCAEGERCVAGRCIEIQSCRHDNECSNDTYCDEGQCIPWGTGPKGDFDRSCSTLQPIGLFAPAIQCAWSGPPSGDRFPAHRNVLGTPLVVDFDFDGDPQQRHPSIVFVSYDGTDGKAQAEYCADGHHGVIRVIDGERCAQQQTVDPALGRIRAAAILAVADLDADGRPEIVALRCEGGVVAFTYDRTQQRFTQLWDAPHAASKTYSGWTGPSIHDLDNDGKPEVLSWGVVWGHDGRLLDDALGDLSYDAGFIPVVADLQGDGLVELTNGETAWQWREGRWQPWKQYDHERGQVAFGDFGTYGAEAAADDRQRLDGVPEIAVVAAGQVRVQTLDGRIIFGPLALPAGGTGGAPTIGDFDKDGRAELAAAGSDSYTVFDLDCGKSWQAAPCQDAAGILWTSRSQDHSSNVTGSSVFDFEGDGAAEAVYADECFTRVYDGRTGEVLFSQWRTSCTWYDNPVIADVDGDFNAEIVVSANANCQTYEGNENGGPWQCATDRATYPERHPLTDEALDPLFAGLRCRGAEDCPGGSCNEGLCRCNSDAQCGSGGGFGCTPPRAGTAGAGNVCRAVFKGYVQGVRVYRDIQDRWVRSRMIWNQHAYAVTNVDETGTVPRTSAWQQNWKQAGLNNFRQNVQGSLEPGAQPDLTVRRNQNLACEREGWRFSASLCNRGLEPVGAGTPVTFYRGARDAGGTPLCIGRSEAAIGPGVCTEVTCLWQDADGTFSLGADVYAMGDDDGTGLGQNRECKEGNNGARMRRPLCTVIY
ncbi:MAG: VCBS repeat-containing protein [Proteobacteria bacterium]|nr:VCBS repeat-containing protein [Pseudomonadota bacterium]